MSVNPGPYDVLSDPYYYLGSKSSLHTPDPGDAERKRAGSPLPSPGTSKHRREVVKPGDKLLCSQPWTSSRWPALRVVPVAEMPKAPVVMRPGGENLLLFWEPVSTFIGQPFSGCQKSCRLGLKYVCFKMHFGCAVIAFLILSTSFGCPFVISW